VRWRRFILMALVMVLLLLGGTFGFYSLEDWSLFQSLYFTVVTLTTIGYGDVVPQTPAGRVFTMLLALGGVFTLFYLAAEFIRVVVSGDLQVLLGKQLMERTLAELRGHLIVCGYGRMGRLVSREFAAQGLPFVVIDREDESLEGFDVPHGIPLQGDATLDDVLKKAGVERARALVTVAPSDADNLFITMSARLLNARLFIVARAENEQSEQKLVRAGANRVVSPYVIGGRRVAHAVLRPTVVDFIDLATRTGHLDLQIEETQLASWSALVGRTIKDSAVREKYGVMVVAIKKASGQMVYNPPGDAVFEAGDILIALGQRQSLDELEKLAGGGAGGGP
jgi:voltage-gated potassium channel